MNKIALIAKSEYLRRVRSKWFIVATLGVPFLAIAAFALPALAFSDDDEPSRVAVVDDAGLFADLEAAVGDGADLEVADAPLDTLRARVLEGDLDGVLVLPAGIDTLEDVRATYYAKSG
ncbi:MAG: ABC transporter permease, partial [Rubrivirga sp.]